MKASTLKLILTGLVLGSGAGWLLPPGRVSGLFAERPAVLPAAGHTASVAAAPGIEGRAFLWRELRKQGQHGTGRRLALAELVSQASSAEIRQMLKLTPPDHTSERELLLRRWVELDPAAAGAWAAACLTDDQEESGVTDSEAQLVFTLWAVRDPGQAMATIEKSANPWRTLGFSYAILNRVLELDMAAGIAFGAATKNSGSVLNWSVTRDNETGWIEKEPARAAALLGALPPGEFRDNSLCGAISVLAQTNLPAAVALQQKFPALQMGPYSTDPRTDFYGKWAQQDLAGLTTFVNEHAGGPSRRLMKQAIARALGDSDPATGLDWASENLSGGIRLGTVKDLLTKLAKANPAAALGYIQGLPEGTVLGGAAAAFSSTFPPGHHTELLALASGLPEGPARQRLASNAYELWYRTDPTAALNGMAVSDPEGLPEGIWSQLGNQSGSLAEGMRQLGLMPEAVSSAFVRSLWRRQSGERLSAEALHSQFSALRTPDQRHAALEGMVESRRWSDAAAMVGWAKALPAAGDRQWVAELLSRRISHLPAPDQGNLLAPLR